MIQVIQNYFEEGLRSRICHRGYRKLPSRGPRSADGDFVEVKRAIANMEEQKCDRGVQDGSLLS